MITKQTNDFENLDFYAGEVILIDKDLGKTSFDVVWHLRKIFKVKKIGHAGTLDPKATGLLILCTGKKTKEISKYQDLKKTYSGIIEIGKTTPSMDSETEISEEKPIDGITEEKIDLVRKHFLGKITQVPPMYSAIKHKGKALYKYARKGKEVTRSPREIEITKFDITKIDLPYIHFRIECSKGTYIRVIADDFGKELGCGAYLKSLRREKIGDFSVDEALTISELREIYSSSVTTV